MNLIIVVKFERAFDALEGTIKYPIQGSVLNRCHISVPAQFKLKFDSFCSSLGTHLRISQKGFCKSYFLVFGVVGHLIQNLKNWFFFIRTSLDSASFYIHCLKLEVIPLNQVLLEKIQACLNQSHYLVD